MTTSLLLFKALLGSASVGGCLAAGGFALHHNWTAPNEDLSTTQPQPHAIVLVHGTTDAGDSPTEINITKGQENYKCKLSGNLPSADCKLTKLHITNGWIDLGGIKKATQTTAIPKADLAVATNYFKLEVDKSFYSSITLTAKKTIEIVLSAEPTKKFGTLNPLFKFSDGGVEFEKTQHLLGKVESSTTAVVSSDSYQCPLQLVAEASDLGACSFFPFGTTTASLSGAGYSNQTAISLPGTKASSVLTENNYYLIQYDQDLDKTKIGNPTTVQINKVDSSTPSYTKAGSFKDVVPVILDGTTGSKTAFILSETPSYSVVVKKTAAITSGKTLTHDHTTKNYQCRLDSASPVDCNLVPLSLTTGTKTSFTTKDIEASSVTSPLTINSATIKPTYYKLEVDPTFFSNFSSGDISSKHITVVEVKIGETTSSPLFTLDPLFSIGDNGSVHFDKSTFIVKGADFTNGQANGTLTSGKNRFCSFTSTDKGGTNAKQCSLIDLGATLSASQTFAGTATTDSIDTAKTYLVKFETPTEKGFSKADNTGSEFFIFESGADETPTNRKQIAKFSAANVQPTIMVDDTTPNKYAFILRAAA